LEQGERLADSKNQGRCRETLEGGGLRSLPLPRREKGARQLEGRAEDGARFGEGA
jgi:hypothetical protein